MRLYLIHGLVLAASVAHAQPGDPATFSQLRDDRELADAVAVLAQDAAFPAEPTLRARTTALVIEGVRQLRAQSAEQALANFLEAYATFPSPRLLLDIAATLRELGRNADAANTYQRYLADPKASRAASVEKALAALDAELTVLAVDGGNEVSIDGGPFISTLRGQLLARVRPGIHLVRVRRGSATEEITVNGFAGETKQVGANAQPATGSPVQYVWLEVGTQYVTQSQWSNHRATRAGFSGPVIKGMVPPAEADDDEAPVFEPPPENRKISSGAIAALRLDGEGRGVAGALGFSFAPSESVSLEIAGLKSALWGVYAGLRVRFMTGRVRPYAGAGIPIFFFYNDATMQGSIAAGLRAAGGGELKINRHVSVHADLGVEHFFNLEGALVDGKRPDTTMFVPSVGVIGRL